MKANDVKKKMAVALNYDQSKSAAPQVKAKGYGITANKMIEIAEANNIPIQKDESLIELLMKIEIDEQIPEELYHVVAEIFAFLYELDKAASN